MPIAFSVHRRYWLFGWLFPESACLSPAIHLPAGYWSACIPRCARFPLHKSKRTIGYKRIWRRNFRISVCRYKHLNNDRLDSCCGWVSCKDRIHTGKTANLSADYSISEHCFETGCFHASVCWPCRNLRAWWFAVREFGRTIFPVGISPLCIWDCG